MRILIIEDEAPAANRLKKLVLAELPTAEIVDIIDSVEHAVSWFNSFEHPAIVFMDIQLADGLSFTILEKTAINSSIVFTTAFDHYAVKAFRVNGLDYLLKPIDPLDLKDAIQKHLTTQAKSFDYSHLMQALSSTNKQYKDRLLVKLGDKFLHIQMKDVAYFYAEDGVTYSTTLDGAKHLVDYTLENLQENLNPKDFFRINRKVLININGLNRSHAYFNSRLKLDLSPAPNFDVIVSREKVSEFKLWLDN